MEKTTVNECVAQGAAIWRENQLHEKIMKALEGVYGYWQSCQCDYGHSRYWSVHTLPTEELKQIMDRGNHEEIMYMIRRYGEATPPEHFVEDCTACHGTPTTDHIIPEEIQEMIAIRGNQAEIDAYLSYQGFGAKGQDVILTRGDHNEIMAYLSRHGLLPAQQRRLINRGNQDEILLHISRHGLSPELLDEMFARLKTGGDVSEYYAFITRHELPVAQQIKMLQTVKEPEFKAYVERYGLWEDAHMALVENRSEDELICYVNRHRYLNHYAERLLAQKRSHRLNMAYIQVCVGRINPFWLELLEIRPLDYEALSVCFQKLDYQTSEFPVCDWNKGQEEEDIRLMEEGSHDEVMQRIKHDRLTTKALAYLFFRDNPEEFETYLDTWLPRPQAKAGAETKSSEAAEKKEPVYRESSSTESSGYEPQSYELSPIAYGTFL